MTRSLAPAALLLAGACTVAKGTATDRDAAQPEAQIETGAGPEVVPDMPSPPDGPPGTGTWIDPSLPRDTPGKFGGAVDVMGRPEVVYPLADSMHPINIGDITVQWRQGTPAHTVFRLRFEALGGSFDFFAPCTVAECVFQLPEKEWLGLAAARAGLQVSLIVSGTDGKGGPVSHGAPQGLAFSPGPVKGGLYYWSTAEKGTLRLTLGARKAAPFILPDSSTNPAPCGGCHSVSRNGKVIAFSAFPKNAARGALGVAPTTDPTRHTVSPGRMVFDSSTMALNPDGSRVLVSFDARLTLFDAQSGAKLGEVAAANLGAQGQGYFPEWSPDGKSIALVLSDKRNYFDWIKTHLDYDVASGEIAILPYNDGMFGAAKVIVPQDDKLFHFYPSWSPDGKWIAFTSAPVGTGLAGSEVEKATDSTYNHPQARLRLVASSGGPVHDLVRATQQIGRTSTWPKFTPFVQDGGNVMFIAFNSKLDYGFRLKNGPLIAKGVYDGVPQLWMAAIDVRKIGMGDPSTAPIWLPFQDVNQKNHLPYWTEVLACGGTSSCPEGLECRDMVCQSP